MSIITKIFGDANKKYLKKIQPLIEKINGLESKFEKFSDEQLKLKTEEFKKRLKQGESLDSLSPEAFALVRESAKKTLSQRHFDVQLIGGIVLHQGKIAEMKTGEGKTLAATLSVYLNALEKKGVHIVTVNDYLAKRDTVWMGQIYHLLGMSVGCITHEAAYIYDPEYQAKNFQFSISNFQTNSKSQNPNGERDKKRDIVGGFKVIESYLQPVHRKEAYLADITYGTNSQFGFDYLRDNTVYDLKSQVQRELNFAIVDEVDSILIDEARTPLIIAIPDAESTKICEKFAQIVPHLQENTDYNIDEKRRTVSLTDEGITKVEKKLGVKNIYEEKGIRELHHLEEALRARALYIKDKDYVVKDRQVIIVDEFTGRLMPGRRYAGGLHQAIEAKEGVKIQQESRTLATITFQNYFRMYKKLAGMTGTAATSAEEFHKVYGLEVIIIPTNLPMIRDDFPDRIYKTEKGKFESLIKEIKERHQRGQPILVGTPSIEKNEYLGKLLERQGVPHQILNAKHHEKEGEIIAQAGKLGQVTVATNMAGRGVDIILGGNPLDQEKAKKVKELGGLHVMATERHEARRIDNQLRGRAGRQGDYGSSQFFISSEDNLMKIFGGDKIKSLLNILKMPEDQPIENKFISKAVEDAQTKVEGFYFDARKHVLEYDDVMNKHREMIYKKRKEILEKSEIKDQILEMIKNEIKNIVTFHCPEDYHQEWNLEEVSEEIKTIFLTPIDIHLELKKIKGKLTDPSKQKQEITNYLVSLSKEAYRNKEKEIGLENMRNVEKTITLQIIDSLWKDHLENMEDLKDTVNLRAYAQRTPLVEYKIEGHKMFQELLGTIESKITRLIFKIGLVKEPEPIEQIVLRPNFLSKENVFDSSSSITANWPQKNNFVPQEFKKIGRNDPCPCGKTNPQTGKSIKYKKCCYLKSK